MKLSQNFPQMTIHEFLIEFLVAIMIIVVPVPVIIVGWIWDRLGDLISLIPAELRERANRSNQ